VVVRTVDKCPASKDGWLCDVRNAGEAARNLALTILRLRWHLHGTLVFRHAAAGAAAGVKKLRGEVRWVGGDANKTNALMVARCGVLDSCISLD
jgi:hypothetical protein